MSKSKWWYYGSWDDDDEDDDWSDSGTDSIFGTGGYYGRKYKSSLGWSSNRLTDTTSYYSSWKGSGWSYTGGTVGSKIGENRNNLILLTKAYKAVRDMVVILDFPFEVIIKLSNSASYTIKKTKKTRTIFVPSKVIDSPEYSDDEKISILCGLGIHEASHLKYSEYRVYANYSKSSGREERFFMNILEDIRVEDKLLSERPGYLNFIEDSIKYSYESLKSMSISISEDEVPPDISIFLINVINFIRYPDKLNASIVKKHESFFREMKATLSGNHQFTKDSCVLGTKLLTNLKNYFKELEYDEGYIKSFINYVFPDSSFELRYGQDAGTGVLCGSEVSRIFAGGDISKLYDEIITGEVSLGDSEDTFIIKPAGDYTKYTQVKDIVKKYIPGIKKLIQGTDKNYDFVVHGCREGLLDTTKLAEAYQGVPQVYIKKGKVTTNKTTVCVLIDESGSMSGCKEALAQQAAVLLNEALKDLPGVDLYIYGHTADEKVRGDTIIYTYREGDKYKPKYSLSASKARFNNRDGYAILEVAKRVRKQTQEKCIMFVLSDGSPAASYYGGWSAIQDVRNKVKTVEGMGFSVIQVSIDHVNYAREMFSNVISLEYDISNLPKKLSQIIKKAIVKDKVTTTVS